MSEKILLYQALVLCTVLGAAMFLGRKAMIWVAGAWAIWTLVMVFTTKLFVLQLGTIVVGIVIGQALLRSTHLRKIRARLVALAALAVAAIASLIIYDSQNPSIISRTPPTPTASSTPLAAPLPAAPTRDLYEEAVTRIEGRYPALDQRSLEYRPDAVDLVVKRHRALVSQGIAAHQSIEQAADEVMAPGSRVSLTCKDAAGRVTPPTKGRCGPGQRSEYHN